MPSKGLALNYAGIVRGYTAETLASLMGYSSLVEAAYALEL
jgi:hypothetical protein